MSGRLSRIISVVMTVVIILSTLLVSTPVTVTALRGDVTEDGARNMMDVMTIYRHVSGAAALSSEALPACDLTDDTMVNMMDVMTIYRVVSGAITLPEKDPDPVEDPEPVEPEPVGLTPLDPTQYYGRSLLAKENSNMVEAYDYIDEQVKLLNADIALWEYGLTLREFERVFRYYRDDHPEAFWVSGAYGYMYYKGSDGTQYMYSMQQNYGYTKAQIDSFTDQLEAVAEKCVEGMTDATPKSDCVKAIHDYLVLSARYDTTYKASYTHDLRGVLLGKTGVCESYARAFQYLMYRCGIPCALAFGIATSGESHMWNVLQLDGDWYQMDVTWDDPVFETGMETYIGYKYYNVTTKQILSDRNMQNAYSYFDSKYQISYPVPNCTATKENYELKEAVEITSFDVSVMAPVVAETILNDTQAIFKPIGTYTMTAFRTDFENPTKHWELIHAVNALLPADKQLTRPGYSITPNTTSGLWSVYLRNMPA